jgi:hypothetical protein
MLAAGDSNDRRRYRYIAPRNQEKGEALRQSEVVGDCGCCQVEGFCGLEGVEVVQISLRGWSIIIEAQKESCHCRQISYRPVKATRLKTNRPKWTHLLGWLAGRPDPWIYPDHVASELIQRAQDYNWTVLAGQPRKSSTPRVTCKQPLNITAHTHHTLDYTACNISTIVSLILL